MALYAIGDLHLHFQTSLPVKGQSKGVWRDHEDKVRRHCDARITEEDTLVLVGDHSWGKKLEECEEDFRFIEKLPGRKILLRGNHDMFWDAKKTAELNERFSGKLFFLQDNYASYRDYALVGTKGFTFEGPFYINARGKVVDWDSLSGRWSASGDLSNAPLQMVFTNTSYSSIIRLQVSWRRIARLLGSRRNTGWNRWYTPTVMESIGFMTAFRGSTTESATVSYRGIICAGSRARSSINGRGSGKGISIKTRKEIPGYEVSSLIDLYISVTH